LARLLLVHTSRSRVARPSVQCGPSPAWLAPACFPPSAVWRAASLARRDRGARSASAQAFPPASRDRTSAPVHWLNPSRQSLMRRPEFQLEGAVPADPRRMGPEHGHRILANERSGAVHLIAERRQRCGRMVRRANGLRISMRAPAVQTPSNPF